MPFDNGAIPGNPSPGHPQGIGRFAHGLCDGASASHLRGRSRTRILVNEWHGPTVKKKIFLSSPHVE